jgi:hypothetical protein
MAVPPLILSVPADPTNLFAREVNPGSRRVSASQGSGLRLQLIRRPVSPRHAVADDAIALPWPHHCHQWL